MTFVESAKTCLTQKYACFTGRASRSEFWWFYCVSVVLSCVASMIGNAVSPTVGLVLQSIVALGILCPGLGVAIRRMHDIGKSGWAVLITVIPLVGAIIYIIWCAKPSQPQENQYGPVPES